MTEGAATDSRLKPLLGTDNAVLDGKGRILLSKKKRDRLGDNFALCLGDNGCLYAYPGERWDQMLTEIFSADPTNPGRQTYTRLVLGNSDDEMKCDDVGRVVVPKDLREKAGLKGDVIIIGCGDRLEIWAAEAYAAFEADPEGYNRERREAIRQARREMKLDVV